MFRINIGIIGSRRRDTPDDYILVSNKFYKIADMLDTIVSGGCPKGGDRFAEILADEHGHEKIIHYPDKSKLDPKLMEKNPRAAYAVINYARNQLIADDSNVIIACVAPNRKGGTEDTIKRFLKRMRVTEQEAIDRGILYLV